MIRHLFKLVWNRKRSNALLVVEIAISFTVLFGVVLVATYFADNLRRDIGYSYDDVWYVGINQDDGDATGQENGPERMRLVLDAVRDMPEVEQVAGTIIVPFTFSHAESDTEIEGGRIHYQFQRVTDEFASVLGLQLVEGRWFSSDDDGANVEPVVVNRQLADAIAPDGSAVGRLVDGDEPDQKARIVGVVAEYRQDGELSGLQPVEFRRSRWTDGGRQAPRNLLVKVRPGTGAAFEEQLVRKLQSTVRDWSFEAKPVAELHDGWVRIAVAPLIVVGLIAGFLMLMVGFGLTGVLWQNITQRTKEIGLRRVQGATAGDILVQFLGELLVVTTFGLVVGALVVAQGPILGVTGGIGTSVYSWSIIIASALVYLLAAACGLYPSLLATRIQPVEALRYE